MTKQLKKYKEIFSDKWKTTIIEYDDECIYFSWIAIAILYIALFGVINYRDHSAYVCDFLNITSIMPVNIILGIMAGCSIIFCACYCAVLDEHMGKGPIITYWVFWQLVNLLWIIKIPVLIIFTFCYLVFPAVFYYLPLWVFTPRSKKVTDKAYTIPVYRYTGFSRQYYGDKQVSRYEYNRFKANTIINEITELVDNPGTFEGYY